MSASTPKLDIEQLKKKHKDLDAKRIAAMANLQNAEKRLAELKQEARDKWQTDDLDELRQKLDAMKRDNEDKRAKYQAHIEQIEARLGQVEREFSEAQKGTP